MVEVNDLGDDIFQWNFRLFRAKCSNMVVQLYNVVNILFNKDSNLLVTTSSIYVKHTTCFEQITVLYKIACKYKSWKKLSSDSVTLSRH